MGRTCPKGAQNKPQTSIPDEGTMRIAVPRAHCRPPVPLFSFWRQSPRQSRALITKQVSDPFSQSRPVEDLDGDPAQISSNQRTGPHEDGLCEQCPTTRSHVRAVAFQ